MALTLEELDLAFSLKEKKGTSVISFKDEHICGFTDDALIDRNATLFERLPLILPL